MQSPTPRRTMPLLRLFKKRIQETGGDYEIMVYAEQIMKLLDDNPGKPFTLKQIQKELGLSLRPWEPTLYRALRNISKMEGYIVDYSRGAGERTNHITATYASKPKEDSTCQSNKQ